MVRSEFIFSDVMEYRLGVSGGMILKIGPMSLIPSVFLFLLFTDALLVIYLIIIDISLKYFSISILNSYLEDKRQRVSGNSHYFLIRHDVLLPTVGKLRRETRRH